MQHPQRLADIDERSQEQEAERQPHVGLVDDPPESALVAAGHLPGHLRTDPDLVDDAGGVVDQHLGDIVFPGIKTYRPDAVVAEAGPGVGVGLVRQPVADPDVALRNGNRLPVGHHRQYVTIRF